VPFYTDGLEMKRYKIGTDYQRKNLWSSVSSNLWSSAVKVFNFPNEKIVLARLNITNRTKISHESDR